MSRYYSQTADRVLAGQGVSPDGLTAVQAGQRLQEAGPNQLKAAPKKSMVRRIWEQVRDPMVLVLVAAAVVSGVFKETADMIIILVVVVLNAALGIYQENQAEQAIEALQKMSAPHCKVRRGGAVEIIESATLVPGDIVLLEAGDSVPADMRLLEAASLKIEEAALTGESVPADKGTAALEGEGEIPLGDRINMAYMGTSVTYGRGEGVVTATGMDTEMGKIAGILSSTKQERTPLQQKLDGLSRVLSLAVLGICAFIFVFTVVKNGGFSGGHVLEALLTSVSLAVAAIPEGLVVVVTVLLSIGVTKMSQKRAIIRRLTAVETLGCTQVICSDKTGTLTQNKMTVVDTFGDQDLLATAMYLCNDSKQGPDGRLMGDPTETALMEYGIKRGIRVDNPRVGEAPFDSSRKMMSTVHAAVGGVCRQYTKGAPDEILQRCTHIYFGGEVVPLGDQLKQSVLNANKAMADKALRVLGAAWRDHPSKPVGFDAEDLEYGMTFIGLCGMIDPVRPEVLAAIDSCRRAGIKPIMITGDHRDTALAIAKELGVAQDESQAVTGAQLAEMSDEEFDARLADITVYARVQPEHKVRIVKAWKRRGKITAMTGDGVNDAPAIKTADIGIGMGITGTDVTKNVADMVLADDNFATIVLAVEEGRRIYENIRKAVQFLLASNLSEVVALFVATLAGKTLFAPIHILWINLITDTFPAMALGMEEAESDSMEQPPRDAKESIFAQGLGTGVIYQGVIIAGLTLVSFFIGLALGQGVAMTMAFVTLSMCEIFHAFNMRSRHKSIFKVAGHNRFLYGAMILSFVLTMGVVYIPGLNTAFRLTALGLGSLGTAFGIALAIIPIVEAAKLAERMLARRGS